VRATPGIQCDSLEHRTPRQKAGRETLCCVNELNTPILFTIQSIVSKRSGSDTRTGLLPQKILIIDPELIQWDRHTRTTPLKKRLKSSVVKIVSEQNEQKLRPFFESTPLLLLFYDHF